MAHVYMMITKDKYELPLIVADTAGELAERVGVGKYSILSAICKAKKENRKCKYVRVDWNEGEEIDD